jgi:hypothetical protein
MVEEKLNRRERGSDTAEHEGRTWVSLPGREENREVVWPGDVEAWRMPERKKYTNNQRRSFRSRPRHQSELRAAPVGMVSRAVVTALLKPTRRGWADGELREEEGVSPEAGTLREDPPPRDGPREERPR